MSYVYYLVVAVGAFMCCLVCFCMGENEAALWFDVGGLFFIVISNEKEHLQKYHKKD